jgi:hypothetical protein
MNFQVGDRVLGCWQTKDGDRPVDGWIGRVRAIEYDRIKVAFPPYGKGETIKYCDPNELKGECV